MAEYNNLFYVCSLIEFIGRERKLRRAEVVAGLGEEAIRRIYRYADTFHCEQIAKVADDFITMRTLPTGDFDNVASCRYAAPNTSMVCWLSFLGVRASGPSSILPTKKSIRCTPPGACPWTVFRWPGTVFSPKPYGELPPGFSTYPLTAPFPVISQPPPRSGRNIFSGEPIREKSSLKMIMRASSPSGESPWHLCSFSPNGRM